MAPQSPPSPFEALEPRRMFAVTGVRDLLYVRVRFSDQAALPESLATAQANVAQSTKWIGEYSGKNVSFRTKLAAVALPRTEAYYKSAGVTRLADDADAALRAQGQSLSGVEHVSYRYNGAVGTFGGLGQVNGPRTWIRYSSASIITHELGHNIGLGHSSFANPTDNAKPFGASASSEYGDPFSNMGGGGGKDWNAHQKASRGWLGGSRTKTVSATTAGTHTFTLASHDDAATYATTGVYLLKLTLSLTTSYYVSYRRSPNALFVHRAPTSNPTGGTLIDATPSTATASDAGLLFGKTLIDRRGSGAADDITIRVARDGINAKVTVTIGAPPAPPATTTTAAATAAQPLTTAPSATTTAAAPAPDSCLGNDRAAEPVWA
ncbi:MAG TPA: M66 family metalloprotease [Tepidisphaeraceae bacterium]|nr:M66 family metalloprotease [Tepidisphaeraceae bacterium]